MEFDGGLKIFEGVLRRILRKRVPRFVKTKIRNPPAYVTWLAMCKNNLWGGEWGYILKGGRQVFCQKFHAES